MLLKVRTALTSPDTWGLKVTVNGTLWPEGIIAGSEKPPILNTVLFAVAAVTVTFALLAVRLPEAVALLPITTLPTFKVVGAAVSSPTVAVPSPVRGIVRVGFEALEVMVTLPLRLVADWGANVTVKVAVWPAASVTGVVIPFRLNAVPVQLQKL